MQDNFFNHLQDIISARFEQKAFIFLANGEVEKDSLTYAQLDLKARAVAAELQKYAKKSDRILLTYLPGFDFIIAFLACLYAGMIAVPAYPLRNNRHAKRLLTILDDCQPRLVLGTAESLSVMRAQPEFASYQYVLTESITDEIAQNYRTSNITPDMLAFLQYTSGSTGLPKGVMVNHSNIIANLQAIHGFFDMGAQDKIISWLPMQHDMGLIGQLLYTLYLGTTEVVMAPAAFLERPLRWLRAISAYQGHAAGGPNFGFQLCIEKINEQEIHGLDLSSWRVAFNGSEPIRASTLKKFSQKFSSFGFKEQAFLPCYGMAETTLLISGKYYVEMPVISPIKKSELSVGHFIKDLESDYYLVSSGQVYSSYDVKIINPDTLQLAQSNEVGEIWVSGPSVAQGYWNKPEATQEIFCATLPNDKREYLRTGDLGHLDGQELYVTGRLKDTIILQGQNIYPQDVEQAVDGCHPALHKESTAAFAVEINDQEQLVIVAEIERTYRKMDFKPVFRAIRQAVIDAVEAVPYSIQLVAPTKALKTTSGKIQRLATKAAYLSRELDVLASDDLLTPMTGIIPDREQIKQQIAELLMKIFGTEQPDETKTFSEMGGTSLQAVLFNQLLQTYMGKDFELSPTIAFDYPTLDSLSQYLYEQLIGARPADIIFKKNVDFLQEPIAIIGMHCRFPGKSNDPEAFWELLKEGREGIEVIPESRWNWKDYYSEDPEAEDKTYVKHGGFIDEMEFFDAVFFDISPRETEMMDPQQRVVLETVWHALEDAGINPRELKESNTGVFIGATTLEYEDLLVEAHVHDAYIPTGNTLNVLAGRVSYYLGLQGPCLTVDTACSSSLTALHEACSSLHLGETNLAIVGGVNALFSPDAFIDLSKAKMLASDGHCKVFDNAADGYVRGEGCGVVILKRLNDAINDNDRILAVIKSAVVNQDGASSGLTVPNGAAQEKLLRNALTYALLQPKDISYFEAHGTGTKLGDPMETHAISTVYQKSHDENNPLIIGSVKSNIGHLEAAAGMAGLIKVILCLQHEAIPAQINLHTLNSKINLKNIPAQIPRQFMPWKKRAEPRRAGISSFGFSGINAHIIIEEAPLQDVTQIRKPLPKVIFNHQRYWAQALDAKRKPYKWKKTLPLIPERDISTSELLWVIVDDEGGVGENLSALLIKHGAKTQIYSRITSWQDIKDKIMQQPTAGLIYLSTGENDPPFENLAEMHVPLWIIFPQTIDVEEGGVNEESLHLQNLAREAFFSANKQTSLIGIPQGISAKQQIVKAIYLELCQKQAAQYVVIGKTRYLLEKNIVTLPLPEVKKLEIIQELPTLTEDLHNYIFEHVREKVLNVLGIPFTTTLDEKGFFELGMDSLMAVELNKELTKIFSSVNLSSTATFDNPTIRKLSEFIESEITGKKSIPLASVFAPNEPIAIIGMSCRFPGGANSPEIFWQLLKKGFDGGMDIPQTRWDVDSYPGIYVNRAALLNISLSEFDSDFFNISPREAEYMDPQQRILLEETWLALEDACITPASLKDSNTGVFLGICSHDYLDLLGSTGEEFVGGYATTGNTASIAAGRISYVFGFKGPCVAVDTACSSSLVSAHLACQSLRNGECDVAVAGGVNVILSPLFMESLCQLHMLSPEGYCKTFDKNANGYLRGEGCGIILLKRLSDAQRDNDRILAIIKGSAMNQDGASSGLTVPNGKAQEAVIRKALQQAEVNPGDIDYVEVHGTATSLGDPIEVNALSQVFTGHQRPLTIGTVKTNIGHLEGAAGVAGIIKTVLALQHEEIPRHLNFHELNPAISLESIPAQIPLESIAWKKEKEHIRYAGISGFGFSGANAHIIIKEPFVEDSIIISPEIQEQLNNQEHVLIISSKTEFGLSQQILQYTEYLKSSQEAIYNICYTSQISRTRFEKTIAVSGETLKELIENLEIKNFRNVNDIDNIICYYPEDLKPYLRKVSLPKYLFQRKNHWFKAHAKGKKLPSAIHSYDIAWSPLSYVLSEPSLEKSDKYWVIIGDESNSNRDLLAQILKEVGFQQSLIINISEKIILESINKQNCMGVVYFSKNYTCAEQLLSIAENASAQAVPMFVITEILYRVNDHDNVDASNTPLNGLIAQCRHDHAGSAIVQIDILFQYLALETARRLGACLLHAENIDVLAIRGDQIYQGLLKPISINNALPYAPHYKISLPQSGLLEDLQFQPFQPGELNAHEVLIQVKATGVNLRDVLTTLQLYYGLQGEVGLECSGRVLAVGSAVTRVGVGDEVFGITPGAFANCVVTNEAMTVKKPLVLSYIEAASLPIVYTTAYTGLILLAQLKAGEKILIHAAAGGVGLAAIQVAKWIGAEIFATAGSEEKREYLRTLGVKHIYQSRNLNFREEILHDTQGLGVDVVLNSLTSEGFIEASVACTAKHGRFVEIGRLNIWPTSAMSVIRPDIGYQIMQLDDEMLHQPEKIRECLEWICTHFEAHDFQCSPYKVFPITEIKNAFAYLEQARNIGKVVVEIPETFLCAKDSCCVIGSSRLSRLFISWLDKNGMTNVKHFDLRNDIIDECITGLREPAVQHVFYFPSEDLDVTTQQQLVATILETSAHNITFFSGLASVLGDNVSAPIQAYLNSLAQVADNKTRVQTVILNEVENVSFDILWQSETLGTLIVAITDIAAVKARAPQSSWLRSLELPTSNQFRSNAELMSESEIAQFVKENLARVLGFESADELDTKKGFFELGLDSLMAVELGRTLEQRLGVKLSSTSVFDYPNVETLTKYIVHKVHGGKDTEVSTPISEAVEKLSDKEIEAAINELFNKKKEDSHE